MYEDREKKSMDMCVEEDKIGKKKIEMIIKSEGYGWKNKIKNKEKKRVLDWAKFIPNHKDFDKFQD